MKISGIGFVYMITSPSGKIYIGSTIDIDRRLHEYKKLKCKSQLKLYHSLIKYTWDNHLFEIIWAGSIEDMYKYETMIGLYYEVIDKGLNFKLPSLGVKFNVTSEETRIKMKNSNKSGTLEVRMKISKGHMGITPSYEHRQKLIYNAKNRSVSHQEKIAKAHRKPLIQMDLKGNFIKEWESIKEAATTLKINKGNILLCCKNPERKTRKFKWMFKNSYNATLFCGVNHG